MKKVIIASTNPVKIKVAEKAFRSVFPEETFEFIPVASESGVPEQPFDRETITGAYNRITFIKNTHPDADFYISQEGGLFRDGEKLYNRAYIVVQNKEGFITESSTVNFYLPKEIANHVRNGMELGHAADAFFGLINSKHNAGFIGQLTDGLLDRAESYLQSAIIAISEQKHSDWYK